MTKAYRKGDLLSVKVERVVDGDTVVVRQSGFWRFLFPGDNIVVRLYGIDAPESQQKGGQESTKALKKMIRGRGLMMEVFGQDRYDRTVGLFFHKSAGREDSVNLRMVERGWAHAYTRYGGRELGMSAAEGRAKKARLGIWKSRREPEVPSDWRRRQEAKDKARGKIKVRMAVVLSALLVMGLISLWFWAL